MIFTRGFQNYRDLSPQDEEELLSNHFNRVTDTCIPEEEAMRRIENHLVEAWVEAKEKNEKHFPHEFFYKILKSGKLKNDYQIDPKNSWLLAAAEKNLPIIVPGWEDSTCGNFFASHCIEKQIHTGILKGGIDYMIFLADWYQKKCREKRGWIFPDWRWYCR
jgi:deoxyhypusine synthase